MNPKITVLITGGTDGIGKATALQLGQPEASLTLVGRNRDKGEHSAQEVQYRTAAQVSFVQADLTSMREVHRFSQDFLAQHSRLDVLIHSAGSMIRKRVLTAEGLELTFAVQFLSRFVLTQALMPALQASAAPRVLTVAGGGRGVGQIDYQNLQGEQKYQALNALTLSSGANDLLTMGLIQRFPAVHFYNYGPGLVRTTLGKAMPPVMRLFVSTFGRMISISADQAGSDIVQLVSGKFASGLYSRGAKLTMPAPAIADITNQQRLWQHAETLAARILGESSLTPYTAAVTAKAEG